MIMKQLNSESQIVNGRFGGTGEAQILAYRRSAENPPQRHGDHGENHELADECGFDFILGAICVSGVRIHAKQSQFPDGGNEG